MEIKNEKILYLIIIPIITSIIGGILVYEFYQKGIEFNSLITWLIIIIIFLISFSIYLIIKVLNNLEVRDKIKNEKLSSIRFGIEELLKTATLVNWSSDLEEHDTNVYEKMVDLVNDYSITGMDVFSIFRQDDFPTGKAKNVINNYYRAIENAITGRGFRYRRAVVVRNELTKSSNNRNKAKLFKTRPEFYKHWKLVNDTFNSSNAEIKAFFDEGRIIDVAFALFYKGNVFNSEIPLLVLEISVMNIQKKNPIMGLLIIDKPNKELIKAFKGAFDGIFDEKLSIKSISYDTIWN